MSSPDDLLHTLDPERGVIEVDLAVESGVPAFGQPWHAEAFGTSLALSHARLFSWAEWVEIFSEEISDPSAACRRGQRDCLLPAMARGSRSYPRRSTRR